MAEDPEQGIVGTEAFLPRRFALPGGATLTVMQAVDVLVRSDLRGQGIFSGLADFARSRVREPRLAFPNELSRPFAVSQRGWKVVGERVQWSFPVRWGGLAAARGFRGARGLLRAASRGYVSLFLPARSGRVALRPIERFESDYEIPGAIHGVRSAAYLNWRFLDNPVRTYEPMGFRVGAEDLGYFIMSRTGETVRLADFVARRSARACMRAVVEHCHDLGVTHVLFKGVGLPLRRLGFLRRKVFGDCTGDRVPEGRWLLTVCDSDSEFD